MGRKHEGAAAHHAARAAADGDDGDLALFVAADDGLGTPGPDAIRVAGPGSHTVLGGNGDDVIRARDVAASLLDGEAGDDVLRLSAAAVGSTLRGGEGDDVFRIGAPGTLAEGGAGDDVFRVDGAAAPGTVIVDGEGHNRLTVETAGPVAFRREAGGDDLHVLLGDGPFDPTRDVVWKDFFDNPLNRVNGLSVADIAALLPDPGTPPETPTLSQFINAANAVYSRDYAKLPPDLALAEIAGQPVALEVTEAGFYGAVFVTPENQLIVSFEGTYISGLDTQPDFVAAQLLADVQIFLGQTPAAFEIGVGATEFVLAAAAGLGIGAEDVFVTGHSLGAGIAMYVAAQLGLGGTTFAAPGIAASAIPAGATSQLTNYVEYGDPVGNYSANPNLLNGFLQSPDILRFGSATYIGDPVAGIAMAAAATLFGPDTTPEQNAAGLAALAALASTYHPLETYAADLGVTLADDSGSGAGDLLPAIVAVLQDLGFPVGGTVIA